MVERSIAVVTIVCSTHAQDDIYVVNCFNALLGAVYIIFGEGMDGSCAVGRFFAACAFHPLQLEEYVMVAGVSCGCINSCI